MTLHWWKDQAQQDIRYAIIYCMCKIISNPLVLTGILDFK